MSKKLLQTTKGRANKAAKKLEAAYPATPKLPEAAGVLTVRDRTIARTLAGIMRDEAQTDRQGDISEKLCDLQNATRTYDTGVDVIAGVYLAAVESAREAIGDGAEDAHTVTMLESALEDFDKLARESGVVVTASEHAAGKLLDIINDPSIPEVVRMTLMRSLQGLAGVVVCTVLKKENHGDAGEDYALDPDDLSTWIQYAEENGIRPLYGGSSMFGSVKQ
jgi:hypothetical protein